MCWESHFSVDSNFDAYLRLTGTTAFGTEARVAATEASHSTTKAPLSTVESLVSATGGFLSTAESILSETDDRAYGKIKYF